ncbi:nitrate- and nitrite sensing domain-containing protein [Marinobacter caseinilyticus]|uniref:nitrate- and nitrite sensing domain-containing protein n=1 Tax=Marinobacter caseinilyticus TaxID=2692195 RepID=UPI00140E8DA4|nr:nitrate- and nitrite sensing domain-containing protein [Marinobacter caseinilyticus]
MELLMAAASVLTLVIVAVLVIRKSRRTPARRAEGLRLLKGMRHLLEHLQQHRGLTTGFLGGDHSLKPKIDQIRRTIAGDLSNLDASSLSHHDRWQAFSDHWSRLEGASLSLPVTDNLKQHNQLLANVLPLIEDIAAQHALLFLTQPGDGVATLWRELLYTTEWLGQARALGTGIAAAGQSTGVERIRLGFLCERIRALSTTAHTDLAGHSQTGSLSLKEASQTVATLLSIIDTEFLSESAPKLPASTYFDQATKAIGAQFAVVDEMLLALQHHV